MECWNIVLVMRPYFRGPNFRCRISQPELQSGLTFSHPLIAFRSRDVHKMDTISEKVGSKAKHWTIKEEETGISHQRLLGSGGFGEVHEVHRFSMPSFAVNEIVV